MTCPDWAGLARRFRQPGFAETGEWRDAVTHARGCADCRRRAVAIDPLLAFVGCRDLEIDPAEIAVVRRGTHDLRRLRALEAGGRGGRTRRGAIAAGLVLASVWLLPAVPAGPILEAPPTARPAPPAAPAASPWIENLDRPAARVYQWESPEVAVVLVVDESLDV